MSLFRILTGKFHPKDEDYAEGIKWILLSFVVFTVVVKDLIEKGTQSEMVIGLAFIPLPLFAGIGLLKKAMVYRKKRNDAIQNGTVVSGRIVGVKERVEKIKVRRGNKILHCYTYEVELVSPSTGASFVITSSEYSQAVHHWISSPEVNVYIAPGGWKYYLEDFKVGPRKKGEQFFYESSKSWFGWDEITDAAFLVFCIFMILKSFGIIK